MIWYKVVGYRAETRQLGEGEAAMRVVEQVMGAVNGGAVVGGWYCRRVRNGIEDPKIITVGPFPDEADLSVASRAVKQAVHYASR